MKKRDGLELGKVYYSAKWIDAYIIKKYDNGGCDFLLNNPGLYQGYLAGSNYTSQFAEKYKEIKKVPMCHDDFPVGLYFIKCTENENWSIITDFNDNGIVSGFKNFSYEELFNCGDFVWAKFGEELDFKPFSKTAKD
jgi:hypothetical protein